MDETETARTDQRSSENLINRLIHLVLGAVVIWVGQTTVEHIGALAAVRSQLQALEAACRRNPRDDSSPRRLEDAVRCDIRFELGSVAGGPDGRGPGDPKEHRPGKSHAGACLWPRPPDCAAEVPGFVRAEAALVSDWARMVLGDRSVACHIGENTVPSDRAAPARRTLAEHARSPFGHRGPAALPGSP